MRVLSIETSCDETAAAIVEWDGQSATVPVNTVSSQASLHAKWGGVVPQLAAREHIRNIVPVIEETLERGNFTQDDLDAIAVTAGPGLMPALVVGVSAAKTLALAWQKPLIGIQHLEGHIYANLLRPDTELRFPLIALVVSGGHTQLVLMKEDFQYEILGETQDDAAGEAYDKVAKLLGLPYPGGPQIDKRADAFQKSHSEESIKEFTDKFPRPMLTSDNFDFSFSGLKTAVLYSLKKETKETMQDEEFISAMCHAFQEATVDVLVGKTKKALKKLSPKTFVIAGGVSANTRLRSRLEKMITKEFPETQFLTPDFAYSLDNAAMIGIAAALRLERMTADEKKELLKNSVSLNPDANLPLA
ncbi:MAG: tRNA (adenosine(37)-N6)-threonylcarbamoyltransferase complex transferase subunit TsaD [Patescibacteria group bacterium]